MIFWCLCFSFFFSSILTLFSRLNNSYSFSFLALFSDGGRLEPIKYIEKKRSQWCHCKSVGWQGEKEACRHLAEASEEEAQSGFVEHVKVVTFYQQNCCPFLSNKVLLATSFAKLQLRKWWLTVLLSPLDTLQCQMQAFSVMIYFFLEHSISSIYLTCPSGVFRIERIEELLLDVSQLRQENDRLAQQVCSRKRSFSSNTRRARQGGSTNRAWRGHWTLHQEVERECLSCHCKRLWQSLSRRKIYDRA